MLAQIFIASILVAKAMPSSNSFSQKISSWREPLESGDYSSWEINSAEKQSFYENGQVREWRYGKVPGFEAALENIKIFSPKGNLLSAEVIYASNPKGNSKTTVFYDATESYPIRFLDEHVDGYKVDISYSYDNQQRLSSWQGIHNGTPVSGKISYDDKKHQRIVSECVAEARFLQLRIGDKNIESYDKKKRIISEQCYSGRELLKSSLYIYFDDDTLQKEEHTIYQRGKVAEKNIQIFDDFGNLTLEKDIYKDMPSELTEKPVQVRRLKHTYKIDKLGRVISHLVTKKRARGLISATMTHYQYDVQGRLIEEKIFEENGEEARTRYFY